MPLTASFEGLLQEAREKVDALQSELEAALERRDSLQQEQDQVRAVSAYVSFFVVLLVFLLAF
jgi:hypothetical protein